MAKDILIKLFRRRHFWRFASFSEVGELYTARLMRTIAVNVGAAFMSVFMLKNGYSVVTVSIFWAVYFLSKTIMALPFAQLIALINSKKAILISNMLYIPAMISFILLPTYGLWALVVTGVLQAVSAILYDIGYLINFSRIKNAEAPGKQVAFMNIMEKIAKGISPLIGGVLALWFDPRASIIVSALFFVLAAWPMMRTTDTMTTGFRLRPKNFPWKTTYNSLLGQLPMGFEVYASGSAWSIFLASLIFTAAGNQVYAELGMLASLILIVSLGSTYAYGKLIDSRAGGQLMFWTALGTVGVNIIRAITRTPALAVGTNAVNEITITGYTMAFTRGMFDVADQSGYRVMYIGLTQLFANLGACIAAAVLALAVFMLDISGGFTVFYLVTAAAISFMMLARFKVYRQA